MSESFAELASIRTAMGLLSLRRRREPTRGVDVYEVKLGDEFLMSSLFTVGEVELAHIGLAAVDRSPLDVVVGGLGLGYTARAALKDERVRSLLVVEALEEVIDWHREGLLPETEELVGDPRTRLVRGDFFGMVGDAEGLDPSRPGRRFDAILVDIDHSPGHVLAPGHAEFYTRAGLAQLAEHLRPGGAFGLWSNEPPDRAFLTVLAEVFDAARGEPVTFPNFLTHGESSNTVYLARARGHEGRTG